LNSNLVVFKNSGVDLRKTATCANHVQPNCLGGNDIDNPSFAGKRAIPHIIRQRRLILISCSLTFGVVFGTTIAVRTAYESWRVRQWCRQLASSTADDRDAARDALSDMEVDLTDHLIELMKHDNPDVREFAAFSIYRQRPIPYEVVPTFARVLLEEDEKDGTLRWIGDTFVNIAEQAKGPPTEAHRNVIIALRQAIRSDNKLVAAASAYGLDRFGSMAVSAEPDLLELWADKPTIEVGGALCSICPGKYESVFVPVLIAELNTSDYNTMTRVLHYLGRLQAEAADAVPQLQELSKTRPDWAYHIDEVIKKIQAVPKLPIGY
jgi:hypothetical protein